MGKRSPRGGECGEALLWWKMGVGKGVGKWEWNALSVLGMQNLFLWMNRNRNVKKTVESRNTNFGTPKLFTYSTV